jgi:peptide/nickel transport system permease protein
LNLVDSQPDTQAATQPLSREALPSPWRRALRRFLRHQAGLWSLGMLAVIALLVAFGPIAYQVDPAKIDLANTMAASSPAHVLGTDESGRDVLVRLLEGGRVSLLVGLAAMVVAVAIGTLLGATAGYMGGRVDQLLVQIVDGAMAIPLFFLWLIFLTTVTPTPATIVFVIGCTSWMTTARIVRSEILKARALEFVEAARSIGASHFRILFRHCLPQATSSIIVSATIAAAFAIISEAALSFLGIGIQPPRPSWGNMLTGAQEYLFSRPALALYPGIAIVMLVLSLNVFGDALRDVLDPRG